MGARPIPHRYLRRAGLGLTLCGVVTGIVVAQPVPSQAPVAPEAPIAAPPEEAPPATVIAPPPAPVAAPVEEKDVAPAAAPKEQVAEKPAEVVIRRARYDVAVLQALDKVTAETLRFEAAVGRPVRWKGLVFTVRACERSAPNEPIEDSIVYLTIESQPRAQPGRPTPAPREAFKGWMYASSPGLNPLEHATYDAWAISCRTTAPVAALTPPRPPAAKAPAPTPDASAAPKVLDLPAVAPPAAAPTPAAKVESAPAPAPKAAEPPTPNP